MRKSFFLPLFLPGGSLSYEVSLGGRRRRGRSICLVFSGPSIRKRLHAILLQSCASRMPASRLRASPCGSRRSHRGQCPLGLLRPLRLNCLPLSASGGGRQFSSQGRLWVSPGDPFTPGPLPAAILTRGACRDRAVPAGLYNPGKESFMTSGRAQKKGTAIGGSLFY